MIASSDHLTTTYFQELLIGNGVNKESSLEKDANNCLRELEDVFREKAFKLNNANGNINNLIKN